MRTFLSEGITNLEDLDVRAFINAVRRIGQMQATEKLDGAGMWFGLDAEGKLFSTRPGKKSQKFYSEKEYPYFAGTNGFRAAHAALQSKETDIKTILQPGDTVETNVIFGRQPNSTSYGLDGKNFIALIRGVEGTNDIKVDHLMSTLNNQEVSVRAIIVDTEDGENLDRKAVSQMFRFVGPQRIKDDLIKDVKLEKHLKKLEQYLDNQSSINNLTNFELMSISLGSIPKEQREEAKAKKEEVVSAVKTKFKLVIKKELLDNFVSKVKPSLSAADLSGDEDTGVSGVVFKDPDTGELIDVIDKDSSNTLNAFNYAVRNQVAGSIRTVDDEAPLESRGGITGQMKIRIADLLGNKELAMTRAANEVFSQNRGDTPTATIRNVAKTLNGAQDFNGVKRKIDAVIQATLDELQDMLQKFKKHKDDPESTYRLRMKNGKAIGLSPEVVKRTLMTFAEARRNLAELKGNVADTKAFDQLVAALYGKIAKDVHAEEVEVIPESLNEEFLSEAIRHVFETKRTTDKSLYTQTQDAWHLVNAYLATVMMAVVMYKAKDTKGIWLLRDKHNYRMAKYDENMSAVNFWGYALWKSKTAAVQKLLGKETAREASHWVSKVSHAWVNLMHLDLSYAHDVPIDWDDHLKTLKFLVQHSDNVNTERVNTLLKSTFAYDEGTFDEKAKFLPKLYFYAMQFVPSSPLLTRIRVIQNKLLGAGADADEPSEIVMAKGQKLLGEDGDIAATVAGDIAVPQPMLFKKKKPIRRLKAGFVMTKEQKLLGEDGEIATSSADAGAQTSTATTASAISQVQTGVGIKRQIVRRKRNPDIKFKKFERPKQGDVS